MPTSRARAMRASSARSTPRTGERRDCSRIRTWRPGTAVAFIGGDMLTTDRQRFHPSPAVKASISSDGLVLLDVDGGLVLSSNPVGARIWELIAQQRTATEIARQLVDDYAIPLDVAQRDVDAFVADLIDRGLVSGDPRR